MIRHMRRSLKKFLCLPIHTSHQTLNQAFLDLEMYTTHHAAKISNVLAHSYVSVPPKPVVPEKLPYLTIPILQKIYGSKCNT